MLQVSQKPPRSCGTTRGGVARWSLSAYIALGVSVRILAACDPWTPSALAAQEPEKTAAQAYKNVQVLNDAPASRFMNTMFFQRYALGVSCTYCHVNGQWDKDDKSTKVKAREMMKMVLSLNGNVFKGKEGVTCYTCHRGSTTPPVDVVTARMPLDEMINPRPATASPKATLPNVTADAVLQKYVAALGGEAALNKIANRLIKGNMVTAEGTVVPFEEAFTSTPARWVSIRHNGPGVGDFLTGYDGTSAWNKDNRGAIIQGEPNRSKTMMAAMFQSGRAIASLYQNLTVEGTANVGGDTAVVLVGTAKFGNQRERLYFSSTSGLLIRRSVLSEGMYGRFTTDQYFEQYRSVDGVMIPLLMSEFTPDFGTVRKLSDVEHNGAIDAAMFRMPKP
jgi:hypothetical protein